MSIEAQGWLILHFTYKSKDFGHVLYLTTATLKLFACAWHESMKDIGI
jgi:hypothetical protein